MAEYTIRYEVEGAFDETVDAVIERLAEEGFGVLCDIDVEATLKEKLDEDFRDYRILGACNPPLAHQGMEAEPELGALLPCNVIIYRTDDGRIAVSAIDPSIMLSVVDNPDLDPIADEVGERLDGVLAALPGAKRVRSTD